MEHRGSNQNYVQSAPHTPSTSGATVNVGGQVFSTASTAFHVYSLEWYPTKLVFSVDGNVHFTYNPVVKNADTWPYTKEQYVLMNVAIEGNIFPAFTQGALEVDYVRIYQAGSPTATTDLIKMRQPLGFPNPAAEVLHIDLEGPVKQTVRVQIHTIRGMLVKTIDQEIDGSRITLNQLDQLSKGQYLVTFEGDQRKQHVKLSKL